MSKQPNNWVEALKPDPDFKHPAHQEPAKGIVDVLGPPATKGERPGFGKPLPPMGGCATPPGAMREHPRDVARRCVKLMSGGDDELGDRLHVFEILLPNGGRCEVMHLFGAHIEDAIAAIIAADREGRA